MLPAARRNKQPLRTTTYSNEDISAETPLRATSKDDLVVESRYKQAAEKRKAEPVAKPAGNKKPKGEAVMPCVKALAAAKPPPGTAPKKPSPAQKKGQLPPGGFAKNKAIAAEKAAASVAALPSASDSARSSDVSDSYRSTTSDMETEEALLVLREDNRMLTAQIEESAAKEAKIKAKLEEKKAELKEEQAAKAAEASARAQAEAEVAALRKQLAAAEAKLENAAEVEEGLRADKAGLEATVAEREADIDHLAGRAREMEMLRRKMHETISELKGNIRVFCRVRPTTAAEGLSLVKTPAGVIEPTALELHGPESKGLHHFKFDRVFGETATQGEIFHEVSQLTQSALDGYKVCIFAYGQTGSGKTHTMAGGSGDKAGVVPRAAAQVFESAAELGRLGWAFEFRASCMEIYNEELRDLLPGGSAKLKISDAHNVVSVPDLKSAAVEDAESLASLLESAQKGRATAATKCNAHSSRSHYIFRMSIKGRNATSGEAIDGELNLVDLAGSERVKESGVSGDAMREATFINKSLSALGNTISAMGSKKAGGHVNYRDSKLTQVLKDSLSGNAKTLMFVNVNPASRSHSESLSSLNFAARVNTTEVGPAEKKKVAAK